MYQPLASLPGPPNATAAAEILYQSEGARVYRLPAAPGVVFKQALGRRAPQRLRHEKELLARLAGVEGVARLAAGAQPDDALALEDAGQPLAQRLAARPMEVGQLLGIALRLARTLAGLHRAGVIHRDLSTANILCDAQGQPTLVDFDLATSAADERPRFTHHNRIAGTLAYMAPEQTGRTSRATDHRADLYSLGVVLYEAATGRLPFTASDPLELMHGHLVQVPTAPAALNPRVPARLSELVLRLLEKEPDRRYQGAEGLAHDLEGLRNAVRDGTEADFVLGRQDFGSRLLPPSRPLGRDAEIAALHQLLAAAAAGQASLALVAGAAGAGKTALVNELRPLAAARQGWLVATRFERDASMAAFDALRGLGRLLLAEPEEQLARHRQRIVQAVGPNLGLGATQLPEFQLLLGHPARPPVADPREAEARTIQVTVDILRSVASPERPLVMVLDDLQWAPPISLRFLHAVATEATPGLLVVGAYRTAEAGAGHPLGALLRRWDALGIAPRRLDIGNLPPAAFATLVAQMLRQPPAQAQPLAQALFERTAGNPHDAVELVNALRHEGLLRHAEGGWQWDVAAVRTYVGDSSVPELLGRRVARLPPDARQLLQTIACLGDEVRLATLEIAAGQPWDALHQRLAPCLDDGLLIAAGGEPPLLRFRHARVHQAALDGMDAPQRARLHLAMARRLAPHPDLAVLAAEQYLPATAMLADDAERGRAAALFQAAAAATGVVNFAATERFLAAAIGLLEAAGGGPLLRRLQAERHKALFGLGRLEEGDAVYAALAACPPSPIELAAAAGIQMHSLAIRSRYDASLALGLDLLGRLGLAQPADRAAAISAGLRRVQAWTRSDDKLADFDRPVVDDARALAIASVMMNTSSSAYFCDAATFAWLALESHRMWTEAGPCAQLVAGACTAATLLVGVVQDHRGAYAGARHVLAVGEARGLEPGTSLARFSFALSVAHWVEPLEQVVESYRCAREGLMRAGDFRFASYTYVASDLLFDCAPRLDTAAAETEAGLAFAARSGNTDYSQRYLPRRQLARALRGATSPPGGFNDAGFDEAAHVAGLAAHDTTSATYHAIRSISAAIFGDAAATALHAGAATRMQMRTPGYYIGVVVRALHSASLAQRARELAGEARSAAMAELDQGLDWLRARAADAPANYLHLVRWLEAERAWTAGSPWEAGAAFDTALQEAALHPRPWHRALITERAALFHLGLGLEASGRKLLGEARDRYEAWGAAGKVQQMERGHPFLRGHQPGAGTPAGGDGPGLASSDAIDLLAVVRASQSLSSETSVQQLRLRVAELLGAMTGASQVSLALWDEDVAGWRLPAAGPDGSGVPIRVEEAGARGLLPLAAFRYAERTREVLLVEDARHDDRFADDPYVAALERCSLLLVPILSHGTPRAMLVLENRLSAGAFSAERLDAVRLIAGQLAVSLENALLYQQLEQRVQERTGELRAAQAELVATARRAGMAEIATNVLHNVGNVLNSVNVSANIVSTRLRTSRAHGLARAVQMIQAHSADLPAFLTGDEKGRLLPAYLSQVNDAIAAEQREVMEELANLTRSVEHIKDVVATQQSHAGISSVIEPADVRMLLDDALRISSLLLERHQVVVQRDYADVPMAQMDKARVMQILVNLTRNAVQAMEAVPGERRLTLRVEQAGAAIRVRVTDVGAGICAENITRIFGHGFTTRQAGHGFGLHSCALAAREMGGMLTASSDGIGHGATFALELPLLPPTPSSTGRPA